MGHAPWTILGLGVLVVGLAQCGSEGGAASGRPATAGNAGDSGADATLGGSGGIGGSAGTGGSGAGSLVPRPAYAYPSDDPDVCFVPLDKRLELQKFLDDDSNRCPSHKVRVEGGDYRSGGLPSISLKSGYEIYGLPGMGGESAPPSTVPSIRIQAGTERAVVSTLRTDIEFEPGDAPTRHNLVRRIEYGTLRVPNGVELEENLFLGLAFVNIDIDTSVSGWTRFNRFIYTRAQTNQVVHLRLVGDPQKQSYGNTLLWFQTQGAEGSGLVIQDQGDIALVDVGGEVWSAGKDGIIDDDDKRSALVRVASTPGSPPAALRILNLNGGNILGWPTGLIEVDVDEMVALGVTAAGPMGSPRMVLRSQNKRFIAAHQSMGELLTGSTDVNPWAGGDKSSAIIRDESTARELGLLESDVESSDRSLTANDAAVTGPLGEAHQAMVRNMLKPENRPGEPWERPSFEVIPDPAGPDWKTALASRLDPDGDADSTAKIQALIDGPSIGHLGPGVWYITAPLHIGRGRGLRGAGMGKTAIVAKSPDFDMVIGDDHISYPGTFRDSVDVAYATNVEIYLLDLTLQGGKNGIHHAKESAGDLAQYTSMQISHVAFREMAEAGIFIDRVYAWDTNLFDHLAFVGCKESAIKQRVEHHTGDAPGLAYMDKNFFYESQFIGSAIALDQQGGRASGGNVYSSSLFRDNGAVAFQVAHSADLFASCDFIDNGGTATTPTLSNNGWIDIVSSHFRADRAEVLLRGLFDIEGSTFERGSASHVQLLADVQTDNFLYMTNSAIDFPIGGPLRRGFLSNVKFSPDDPKFSAHTHFIGNGGEVQTLVAGPAIAPGPELLWGKRF